MSTVSKKRGWLESSQPLLRGEGGIRTPGTLIRVRQFSKLVVSATHPPHHIYWGYAPDPVAPGALFHRLTLRFLRYRPTASFNSGIAKIAGLLLLTKLFTGTRCSSGIHGWALPHNKIRNSAFCANTSTTYLHHCPDGRWHNASQTPSTR